MKTLGTIALWAAALVLALLIVRRVRRGERVLLAGRFSPRLVRMIAIVIVTFGWRPDEASAAPDPTGPKSGEAASCSTLPVLAAPVALPSKALAPPAPAVSVAPNANLFGHSLLYPHSARGWWWAVKGALVARRGDDLPRMPAGVAAEVKRQLDETDGARFAPEGLRAFLDAAATAGVHDVFLTAWAFGKVRAFAARTDLGRAEGESLAALFAAADRQARVHDAVAATLAETGPPIFRPWMGKAAAPHGYEGSLTPPPDFAAVLERKLPLATTGTWEAEAVLDVDVVSGASGAALVRHGKHALEAGASLRLRRLDLVTAGAERLVLWSSLGEVVVPAGGVLTAWNLPRFVSAAAKDKLSELVRRALLCNRSAQSALARVLPAAHEALRAAIGTPAVEAPDGRPALRLLLALFEE